MAVEFKLPELGENVKGGTVTSVLVTPGDPVHKGQIVLELETEKAALEVPADVEGVVHTVLVETGDKVEVGQTLLIFEGAKNPELTDSPPPPPPPPPPSPDGPQTPPVEPSSPTSGSTPHSPSMHPGEETSPPDAAPAVRKLAREIGVDVHSVVGTGPSGRIVEDDVKAFAKRKIGESSGPHSSVSTLALPDFSVWGAIERKPAGNIRKLTAERMSVAHRLVPPVTQFDKADVTDLDAARKRFADRPEFQGIKPSLTPFILKAAAAALEEFPNCNASYDSAAGEIIYKKYVHIGVAADTPSGLVVPVIRDVNLKTIAALAVELTEKARRARERKLEPNEMRGGTFTLTNLGGIGGTAFTPIVNWPEVAILGVSKAKLEPALRSGTVQPRLLLPLSLSYDHRLVDGAEAARFLNRIVELLSDPLLLLLA
jgi:pyruvate dehydrogenase E2 component (dihydrolipoamide acetyltransferase)